MFCTQTLCTLLKASADVKISTFLETNGGRGCGSQNGPLIIMNKQTHLVEDLAGRN